ncbi:transglutaminase domain-containing protein [Sphingobacterium corticibacter]|uniref:Transglutaminase-like domain-containing protein n=1 Tax=Sphingobacterium corticibacter TaxID=2171749 RepID=A0A2T8HM19_9SPHI|nr:transglutaminase domain-containing protein [Sphingobacterium corticibacter]PVH26479.1 hypothetical protein DC487_02350 [Sphingobacterium corticibacter]
MILLSSCYNLNDRIDWAFLKEKHRSSSLKLASIKYLQQNIPKIYSEKLVFYNLETEREMDIRLDTFKHEDELRQILITHTLGYKTKKFLDRDILTTDQIDTIISESFHTKQRYKWASTISDSLFLHYVLPYKISKEYPRNWKKYFDEKFGKQLDSLNEIKDIRVQDVTRFLVREMEQVYSYDSQNLLNSQFPDLFELLYSSKGECFRIASLYTYVLRSAGIPAAVDIVPVWGSQNAGHAEYISLDSTGRMTSNVATSHKKGLERAAKVFRLTFENNRNFSDGIRPYSADYPFLIPYLKNDNIIDVTDQHATVFDIPYNLPQNLNDIPYAYICVYNYGQWIPVFWSKSKNGKLVFSKMNTDILYRIALPDKTGGISFYDDVFFLNSKGEKILLTAKESINTVVKLEKTNSGALATLEPNQSYILQVLMPGGLWKHVENFTTNKQGIVMNANLNNESFYRLVKQGTTAKLERPFLCINGFQQWR